MRTLHFYTLLLVALSLAACQNLKPLPENVSFQGDPHPAYNIRFLTDLTYVDDSGVRHVEQKYSMRFLPSLIKRDTLF